MKIFRLFLPCLFLLFWIPLSHGGTTGTPGNRKLSWIQERIDDLHYVVLGTAPGAGGVNGVTIVASTKYVVSPLRIPDDALYADITIRSGSESATILSASAVTGTIDSASFVQSPTVAYFTRRQDADLFASDIQNDVFSGIPSLYVGGIISNVSQVSGTDSSQYEFYSVNRAAETNFLVSYGTYRIPVNAGYLVMKFDSPLNVLALNQIGQFISIRFVRQRAR